MSLRERTAARALTYIFPAATWWSKLVGRRIRTDQETSRSIHKFLPRAAFALACCSSALLAASAANAAGYSAEYVFGDSLSDNGNRAELLA